MDEELKSPYRANAESKEDIFVKGLLGPRIIAEVLAPRVVLTVLRGTPVGRRREPANRVPVRVVVEGVEFVLGWQGPIRLGSSGVTANRVGGISARSAIVLQRAQSAREITDVEPSDWSDVARGVLSAMIRLAFCSCDRCVEREHLCPPWTCASLMVSESARG
jgi:hypothetical protein